MNKDIKKTKKKLVIAKASMSLDGKIATKTGDAKWISCPEARIYNYKFRTEVDGILAGINTVLLGNPGLTSSGYGKNPVRIIIDSNLRIPLDKKILGKEAPTVIIHKKGLTSDKVKSLKEKNITLIGLSQIDGKFDFKDIIKELNEMDVYKILIEGGGETLFNAIDAGVVDEVMFFVSPKIIGGRDAKTPIEGRGIRKMAEAVEIEDWRWEPVGNDLMIKGRVKKNI